MSQMSSKAGSGTAAAPPRYSILQTRLHWIVVGLVILQFLIRGAMVDTMAAVRAGDTPGAGAYLLANLHLLSGLVIGFLMAFRLYLRFSSPAGFFTVLPAAGTSRWLELAARAVHSLFYLLLLSMPLSGLSAWYEVPGAAAVHHWQKMILLTLLILHIAAALVHLWLLRDGVFQRILRLR